MLAYVLHFVSPGFLLFSQYLPRDRLERAFLKWPILCWVWC